MTNKELAENIVAITKDFNVLVRAANLRNLVVDSSLGNLGGNLVVSVSDFVPAIAMSAVEGEAFDEIQKRAQALNDENFKPVEGELQILDDKNSAGQTIATSLDEIPAEAGAHA